MVRDGCNRRRAFNVYAKDTTTILSTIPLIKSDTDKTATTIELMPTITDRAFPPRAFRGIHENVQPLTRHGHLSEQHALSDAVDNVPRPRLQLPVLQSMIQVVASKMPSPEHHAETITGTRSQDLRKC